MKRIGYLYEKICDINNIMEAIKKSAKHKRKKRSVQRVLKDPSKYAKAIQEMLLSGKIEWGQDHYKEVLEPSSQKVRTVTVPSYYPDQIIHWAIMLVLTPGMKKSMVYNCIGSVPGRGPLVGKKRIEKTLSRNKSLRYVEKLDIHHFFPSINIEKLKELLRRSYKDKKLLSLMDEILDRGAINPVGGLPIGYYTSQWLSNYYLQNLDHFILEKLKPKNYYRYVDDIVMFDTNKRKLRKIRIAIEDFLSTGNYSVKIKKNWQIFKLYSRPLDFLGFKFYETYTKLRKRIFIHLNRVIRTFAKKRSLHSAMSASSLLGWLKHIGSGKGYYLKEIKKIVSKGELASIVRKAYTMAVAA